MFKLSAQKNILHILESEPVTKGSVNAYEVFFEFSDAWEGLKRTAVFRTATRSISMALDDSGRCTIPWELLREPGAYLYAGVYGKRGEQVVLPTIWANLGRVLDGADPGKNDRPPTPEVWEQELAGKGDGLDYDGLNLSLMSGDKPLSTVQVAGGGGGVVYRFGHGLKQDGVNVSVDAVSDFSGDNTLPMTAAGVQASVGNIEALLATI